MNATRDRLAPRTRHSLSRAASFLLASLWIVAGPPAGAAEWVPVALTDSLGAEIDSLERRTYHLFPDVEGFQSARALTDGSSYRLVITERTNGAVTERRSRLSAEGWEASRLHARLVERYHDSPAPIDWNDNELEYRLALRFAAESRHDLSRMLLENLSARGDAGLSGVDETRRWVDQVLVARRALYLAGPVTDRSGRTDLMIFSGLYGIWAGVAAPVAFEAEDSKVYAASLLTVPALSMLIASSASRHADMGVGRAHMISTGGWLGTWQGIGWASLSDEAEGPDVVRTGLVSGLAGIATASILTSQVHVTEGQGVLTGHALPWGAWFGLVGGTVAGLEGDELLRASLLGSDALVLGAAIGARGARMSKGRVRLISLMGVVGTIAGFGLDVLVEAPNEQTVMAIAGFGSAAGLGIGSVVTSHHDEGRDLSEVSADREDRWSMAPHGRVVRDPDSGRKVPALGVRVSF